MARITRRSLETLFKKFKPGNEYNPGDRSEVVISEEDKELLIEVFVEYDNIKSDTAIGGGKTGYFRRIIERHDKDVRLLELTKEFQDDGRTLNQKRHMVVRRATSAIKRKLEQQARMGELAQEEVENLKEHYKLLKKEEKEYAKIERGYAKGDAMAEGHVQAVLGISRAFGGPRGIVGSVKGFARGIKNSLKPGGILVSVLSKMVEQAIATDKARAELFTQTGLSNFTSQLVDINADIARFHGPGSESIAKDVIVEMQKEMKGFRDFVDGGEFNQMAVMSGKLKKFGVSVAATTSIYVDLTKSMGMSRSESDDIIKELYHIGKESGMSVEQTIRDFASLLPVYARFGQEGAPQVFRRLAATARLTNLKLEELKDITEGMDTTESAMKTAAKLNAMLGGSFLSGMQLLTAGPAEKIRLIAEAYQKAELKFGVPHDRVKRAIAKNIGEMGVNNQQLMQIVGGNFKNFEKEVAKGEGPATDEEINADLKESMDIQKNIDGAMANLIAKINQKIMKKLPQITSAVNYMANHAEFIAPVFVAAGMAASALYAQGYYQKFFKIPALKTENAALKAQVRALQTAGAAKCTGQLLKQGSGILSSTAQTSMGAIPKISVGAGGTIVAEGVEQASKSGMIQKLGGFFKNSKILNALAKYPIIEALYGGYQAFKVLTNPTLSLKEKSRGFLRVVSGVAGSYLLGLLGSAVPVPGLNFIIGMLGAMAGQYLGEMLAASDVGIYVADNLIQPLLKAFGVEDGAGSAKFREKMAKTSQERMTEKDIARTQGKYVSNITDANLMAINDSPMAMTTAPLKRADFESSKNDGVILERLEKLRQGLVILGQSQANVTFTVGDVEIGTAVTT